MNVAREQPGGGWGPYVIALAPNGARKGACALTATALGGHSRVGFENNIHLGDGMVAPGNAALDRPVADAGFVRERFRVAAS